jgi:hypothetical protein
MVQLRLLVEFDADRGSGDNNSSASRRHAISRLGMYQLSTRVRNANRNGGQRLMSTIASTAVLTRLNESRERMNASLDDLNAVRERMDARFERIDKLFDEMIVHIEAAQRRCSPSRAEALTGAPQGAD